MIGVLIGAVVAAAVALSAAGGYPVTVWVLRRAEQGTKRRDRRGRHERGERTAPNSSNGSAGDGGGGDRKSTRLNSSHVANSHAVFCLEKKTKNATVPRGMRGRGALVAATRNHAEAVST